MSSTVTCRLIKPHPTSANRIEPTSYSMGGNIYTHEERTNETGGEKKRGRASHNVAGEPKCWGSSSAHQCCRSSEALAGSVDGTEVLHRGAGIGAVPHRITLGRQRGAGRNDMRTCSETEKSESPGAEKKQVTLQRVKVLCQPTVWD